MVGGHGGVGFPSPSSVGIKGFGEEAMSMACPFSQQDHLMMGEGTDPVFSTPTRDSEKHMARLKGEGHL